MNFLFMALRLILRPLYCLSRVSYSIVTPSALLDLPTFLIYNFTNLTISWVRSQFLCGFTVISGFYMFIHVTKRHIQSTAFNFSLLSQRSP